MNSLPEEKVSLFTSKIIDYYNSKGRKDLPWRKTKHPWKILLAELLLRKTTAQQAEKVFPYLSNIPLKELAEMNLSDLEQILMPLGIFRERARIISSAAAQAAAFGESLFTDMDKLSSVSGAGQYARNAVQCFAYGKPKPALDRNMIRVLERVFSIKSTKPRPHTDKVLWQTAEKIVSIEYPEEFNWGVLDLSAALCRPKNPVCLQCPLRDICDYFQDHKLQNRD